MNMKFKAADMKVEITNDFGAVVYSYEAKEVSQEFDTCALAVGLDELMAQLRLITRSIKEAK